MTAETERRLRLLNTPHGFLGVLPLGALVALGTYVYTRSEIQNYTPPRVVGIGTSTFAGLAGVDQSRNQMRFEFPFAVGGAPARDQVGAATTIKCGQIVWVNPANIEMLERRPPEEVVDLVDWVTGAVERACPNSKLVVSAGIPRRLGLDFAAYHLRVTDVVKERYSDERVCVADLTAPRWGLTADDGQLKLPYSKAPNDLIHLNALGNEMLMGEVDQFFWYLYQTGICPSQN